MEKKKPEIRKKVDEAWKAKVKEDKEKGSAEQKEKEKEKGKGKGKKEEVKEEAEPRRPLPEPDFSSFISGLGMQALMLLGELPIPGAKETKPDYEQAKYTIDLIDMLKKKTEGNLTKEESDLVENLLYDLRMRYLKATKYV